MAREIADLVQAKATSIGTGPFVLSATPVAGYFTFAEAHTVGATFEYVAREGNMVELGVGTLVDTTHISRAPIRTTNNNALVNFTAAPTIYETVSGDYLRGVDASALPVADSVAAGDQVILLRGGEAFRILASLVGGGSTTPPVDNAPTLSAASATVTGPTSATGSVTTNETGGTLYWLFSAGATATAAAVKAGSNKAVTAIGAQSVSSTALTASTQYYLHFLHRDTANQDSPVLTAGPFTTQAAGAPAPTVTGVTVSPSTANVAGGATQQYTATVAGANSPSQGVNWTCSAGAINSSGLFTAPAATSSAQTITITATSQQDGTSAGTATATVAAVVTGPSLAQQYSLMATGPSVVFPANESITQMTAPSAGVTTHGYAGTSLNFYIKDASGNAPAASTVRLAWGLHNVATPPITFVSGAWETSVQYSDNGAASTSAVPNSTKLADYVNAASFPGLMKPTSSLFAGGAPGKYKLWCCFTDGSAKAVDNAAVGVIGTALAWNLTAPAA